MWVDRVSCQIPVGISITPQPHPVHGDLVSAGFAPDRYQKCIRPGPDREAPPITLAEKSPTSRARFLREAQAAGDGS